MIFLTYQFSALCFAFYVAYYAIDSAMVRKFLLIAVSLIFIYLFGGGVSVVVASVTLLVAFASARLPIKNFNSIGIAICVAVLLYYKYRHFILLNISFLLPRGEILRSWDSAAVPAAIPLGISFFTFEAIHYLVEVRRGREAVKSFTDFLCFGFFWPTMVSGPIKRYPQFIPALRHGLTRPRIDDFTQGFARVAVGLTKKWAADNLSGWIAWYEPQYDGSSIELRWVFLAALSARILLDFSGYSDMAIGFARMMGIAVPENFNWPYLARSPAEFWQRWHISLSSWIRDYIYIPLGGNRLGPARRVANGLAAMTLCGLWHGPDWNFALWGIYHGVGLAATYRLGSRLAASGPSWLNGAVAGGLAWIATTLFVCLGWLLFFYPPDRALEMAIGLFSR